MSTLSEILSTTVRAIGADIKYLRTKLGALTKNDVGLGNVDNTADINKSVASAGRLTTARNIALTGDVTGSVFFDGSSNITITTTNKGLAPIDLRKAVMSYQPAYDPTKTFVRDFPVGSKIATSNTFQPDAPFGGSAGIVETSYAASTDDIFQIAYPYSNSAANADSNYYDGYKLGIVYRRFSKSSPTTEQLKWLPIAHSALLYRGTTELPPNMTIGSDGSIKRSTFASSAPTVLTGVIGDPTNGLSTYVAHGLDPAKIKSVNVKVMYTQAGTTKTWVWQNFAGVYQGTLNYDRYFDCMVVEGLVYISAHAYATKIHGKTATIIIDTY